MEVFNNCSILNEYCRIHVDNSDSNTIVHFRSLGVQERRMRHKRLTAQLNSNIYLWSN